MLNSLYKIVIAILIFIIVLFPVSLNADKGANITESNENNTSDFPKEKIEAILLSISDELFYVYHVNGISLDGIIFNKTTSIVPNYEKSHVQGSSNEVIMKEVENKLRFSFADDNYYGRTATLLYDFFRSVIVFALVPILMAIGLSFMLKPTPRRRLSAKNKLFNYTISIILLFLMPKILAAANLLVTYIPNGLGNIIVGNKAFDIEAIYKIQEVQSTVGDFHNSIMYFAGAVITLWFVITYAYRNLVLIYLYIYFPVFSMFINAENLKKTFLIWVREVVSFLFIPFFDAGLFFAVIKLYFAGMGSFLTIIMIACIIPVRGMFRNMLGIGGGKLEALGFTSLSGAGVLFKNVLFSQSFGNERIVSHMNNNDHIENFHFQTNYNAFNNSIDKAESVRMSEEREQQFHTELIIKGYKLIDKNVFEGDLEYTADRFDSDLNQQFIPNNVDEVIG